MNILQNYICPIREDYVKRLIIFMLLIAFGIIGNVAVLCIIMKHRHLRNAPNILISNLAMADLAYIMVYAPLAFENEIHPCWTSGRLLCAMRNYAPVVCRCACVYSLVALSRERYLAIVHGMHARKSHTKRVSLCWAILAWAVGFIVASPILTPNFTTIKDIWNITISCQSVERGSERAKIYETCAFFILYIFPLTAIVTHYSKMARFLTASTHAFRDNYSTFRQQTRVRKRLAYMGIIITIFFCLFSLPSFIFTFIFHFAPDDTLQGEPGIRFRHLYYFMSLANSSLDPWLVFILSSSHRKRLKACVCCECFKNAHYNTHHTMAVQLSNNSAQSVSQIDANEHVCDATTV